MTTDAEHPESESIDEEKLKLRKIISEAMENNQERTWNFWETSVLYNSRHLTPAGKDTVHWARNILEHALGDDFLQKAAAAPQHPIFFPGFWPIYDLPHSYANLFQVAAEIELLQSKVGMAKVLRDLRRDLRLDRWVSTLLQLEVAGLGLKAGWQIELEIPLPTKKNTDVVLVKESTKLFVETKAMILSGDEQEAETSFYHMLGILAELALNYGVRITSDTIGPPLLLDDQTQWIEVIKETASKMKQDGETTILQGPKGGQVKITKATTTPGISPLAGSLVETDVGKRLIYQLIDKNRQYENAHLAWMYLGDYGGFWKSSGLQGKSLSEKLDILTPYLQTVLASFPNLAGVILSPGKGPLGNNPIEPLPTPIERNGGIAVRCLMPAGNQIRESIIVTQVGKFTEQSRIFANLYANENTWLNWALEKLGKPPFDELVRLSD